MSFYGASDFRRDNSTDDSSHSSSRPVVIGDSTNQ